MSNQDLKKFHQMIMNRFAKDLYTALNSKDCQNYFKKLMQQSVQEEVYDRYTPEGYKRREEKGGLKDPDNYRYEVSFSKKGIQVFMKNETKGVGKAFKIDEGIVRGVGFYDWEKSNIYTLQEQGGFPRDFYTYMEVLVEDKHGQLINILKKHLKRQGWNTN